MRTSVQPFIYEQLALDLATMIRAGTLRPGDRIPSMRRMSAQRRVSIPTVIQAYRVLEARGMIAARPKSGYYVLPPRETIPPPPVATRLGEASGITTSDLIMRVLEMVSDRTLVPLGTALPDPALLPTGALARALGRSARRHAAQGVGGVTPSGALELRREIARRALEGGDAIAADDVVITCGAAEAIALCLRALTRLGDTVAVEAPAYFGTLQALAMLGLKALEIPVDPRTGMRLDTLAEALERGGVAAVVVTPNVHNPLGCIMPDARKRELAALLARHGVPAIEDDTYGELAFGAVRPRTLRSYDGAGLVVTCGSFSKTLAPGYRVGWAIPGRHREQVVHLKLATTAATSVPPQLALAEYLASGGYVRHLRRLRRTLEGTVARLAQEIIARFPEGTSVSRPDGGFLLWVTMPERTDTLRLQRRAAAAGLSVAPGPAFSASGAFANCMRVNAGYAWGPRMEAALDAVVSLLHHDDR